MAKALAAVFLALIFALSIDTASAQQDGVGKRATTAAASEAEENMAEVAADEAAANGTVAELLRTEESAEQILNTKRQHGFEPGFARTPLEAVVGLGTAFNEGNMTEAALYLDLRYLPKEITEHTPEDLVAGLLFVWSLQNVVDLSSISDLPSGDLDDDLPAYRDQVGVITLSDRTVPFYLQHIPDGRGGRIWRISNETIAQLPAMWKELGYTELAVWAGDHLPSFRFLGMTNWQTVALGIALVLGWFVALLISWLLTWLSLRPHFDLDAGIRRFWRLPARVFIYLMLIKWVIGHLGLSVTARVYLESSGIDYLAVTVLLSGLITLFRDYKIRDLQRKQDVQFIALLRPLTLIIKIILFITAALLWANQAGFKITTILAGLGVGSLAVALAAQKTLENIIGAITLYSARPVRPGDMCRFGTTVGVVEEIGLRSVLLRTLDRTLVSIPNAVFSSVEVENLAERDRIRYFKRLQLQMPTSSQLRVILAELRALFLAHPRVIANTVSIRLETIEAATAVLRIDAGIDTRNYQEYLGIAEDLNLRLIDTVHSNGAIFSGAGQVLQVRDFHKASEQILSEVEAKLQGWKQEQELPFPDWSPEAKERLQDSLDFPPEGSPEASKPR
ncbi:hypothetical protein NOR51B_1882 [Luminiphilus syltensis NOR5-1B]|uniref:Mechanosensitive ion channel MscS domain-containing protein n=1 Tax=Luminiphilus syltensis NOR5-1B TaxID=565045 RepID=B8KUR6_9GAMM|nr:mechanosensitive ion channel domain-containing protein [Luminiphilus syltensis]EED35934.1 hypothetical protein NOR51B_1882 [Luminiphilus syltensis NOR5-1B]